MTECPIPCNLCGSSDVEVLGNRDRDGRPLRTTICRTCGLVWSNPRPAEDEVRRYYSREYRLDYKGQADAVAAPHRAVRAWRVESLSRARPAPDSTALAFSTPAPAAAKWSTCCGGSASTRPASNRTSSMRATRARRSGCLLRPVSCRTPRFRPAASTSSRCITRWSTSRIRRRSCRVFVRWMAERGRAAHRGAERRGALHCAGASISFRALL